MPLTQEQAIPFLIEFTKEILLNSAPPELKKNIAIKFHKPESEKPKIIPFETQLQQIKPLAVKEMHEYIPKPVLDIRPLFEKAAKIDLGKLNPLILDPGVVMIECPGPNKFLSVKAGSRISLTKTILTENEIQEIIEAFSRTSKIPVLKGVFKAAVGNLVISAIVSDFIGSRFIISKLPSMPMQK